MSTEAPKERLEKALERLESAIESKISALESENSKLRAEVIKLKSDVKKLSETPVKHTAPIMTLTDIAPEEPPSLMAKPQNGNEQLSDVHLSLSKLKRLVS